MTISELHKKLQNLNVPEDYYYLHGLYGSLDDNDKIALVVKQGDSNVYFKEFGIKTTDLHFKTEDEACNYLFNRIEDNWRYEQIQKIEGLGAMTVNERLYISGLWNEFDACKSNDKARAKQILRWLRVDEPSILLIIK